MSKPDAWLDRLQGLVARYPEYGISSDLANRSVADLWGIYRFLCSVAGRS